MKETNRHRTHRQTALIVLICGLVACNVDHNEEVVDQQDRFAAYAFDGLWLWQQDGVPVYKLDILGGEIVSIDPANPATKRMAYQKASCVQDDVDGLTRIVVRMPNIVAQSDTHEKYVFAFDEGHDISACRRDPNRLEGYLHKSVYDHVNEVRFPARTHRGTLIRLQ